VAEQQEEEEEETRKMSTHSMNSSFHNPGVTGRSASDIISDIEDVDKSHDLQVLLESINQSQALQANLEHLQTLGDVPKLAERLYTDVEKGIDSKTAEARRSHWGTNAMPASPRKDFWTLFVDTFQDATLQILIVAAAVSLAIGMYDDPATGYVEGVAILAAVVIVSFVTAMNDYQKESQFRQLSVANDAIDVVVIRDGLHWQIPVDQVVAGDLVVVEVGDPIPCDGVLVRMDGLQLDESALTGEPIEVDKNSEHDPFVLSGCTVVEGSGQFLAIAVGKNSQWGIIQSHLEKEQEQTPLQEKLDEMAAQIGYIGMGAAALTFVAMMFIKIHVNPEYLQHKSIFTHALDAFIIGVTIVVVAVPEGLPLAVTISLAFSTKKMLADQCLIRHLAACETMGNATNVCSDKTGTLTENRMTVVKGVFADTRHDDVAHAARSIRISDKAQHILLQGIACCTTAKMVPPQVNENNLAATSSDNEVQPLVDAVVDTRPVWIGNKTETALLAMAASVWGDHDDWETRRDKAAFGLPDGSRLFPFSSARKRMTVLVTINNEEDELMMDASAKRSSRRSINRAPSKQAFVEDWTLYHKGAAELVLENCTHYLDADGNEQVLDAVKRASFEKVVREYARGALRCVAMAHRSHIQEICKNLHEIKLPEVEEKLENNMCLDALFGISDPLRGDVVDAVAVCQKAGIFVRMVTGDNLETAIAIAKEAGILKPGRCIVLVLVLLTARLHWLCCPKP
jgi:magnesium-transporting ATPase (P-type)